jgi:uncharacterized protein
MAQVLRRTVLGGAVALAAASAAQAQESPRIWAVRTGKGEVFLFGSTPVKARTLWLSDSVRGAFDRSAELWVENPDYDPAEMNAAVRKRVAEGGPTLAQALPTDELSRLHDLVGRAGKAPDAFDAQPVWAAYPSLSGLADEVKKIDPADLPERVLKARAKAQGKAVKTEWASFEEVFRFSSQTPPAVQLQLIRKSMDDLEAALSGGGFSNAWAVGNLAPLNARDRRFAEAYPELYARLVVERNAGWVPRIRQMLDAGQPAFVCVGIGHLLGPQSIQAQAEAAGLKVRRL